MELNLWKQIHGMPLLRFVPGVGIKRTSYERGYSVECIKDGYIFEVLETSIPKNCGCPVCSNHKVIKGL